MFVLSQNMQQRGNTREQIYDICSFSGMAHLSVVILRDSKRKGVRLNSESGLTEVPTNMFIYTVVYKLTSLCYI